MSRFSLYRWWGIVQKEFLQLRRDRITFGMIVGIPIVQLLLFGYAINTEPRHLPTAVVVGEPSEFTRSFLAAMKTSDYFRFVDELHSEAEARDALERGTVKFVVNFPPDFTRALLRGERPAVLIEADATDPAAAGAALGAVGQLTASVSRKDLVGALAPLRGGETPFEVRVHRLYNPEGLSQHNIVPGLMGVILTMTMVMMTGLAMTRERERGTMENLLATPVRPIEVMAGKIVPYIIVGYVQVTIILVAAKILFEVPIAGSLALLSLVVVLFIAANLAVGFTFSTLAKSQMQAMQMTFFFFLPSLLLSGFMFPFRGMPEWAQWLGEALPLTHFLRVVRGILLKGNDFAEILPNLWPMAVFLLVVSIIALARYRETLD
jgi:ABC-2 type transport system permease protein